MNSKNGLGRAKLYSLGFASPCLGYFSARRRVWEECARGLGVGEKNSNTKFKILCLGLVTYLYFGDYLKLWISTLGSRLGHFRYGYSLLGA